MPDEILSLIAELDRCWIERRFDDLRRYIADDVVMVASGAGPRLAGIESAIESYREFMSRSRVDRYETSDHAVTQRGDTAVAEYSWQMAWESGGTSYAERGREILVLIRLDREWRVIWRTQVALR